MSQTTTVLADNAHGVLLNIGNETIQESKVADPSKFRVGAPYVPGECGGGGGLSFDVTNLGRPRTEVIVLNGGFNGQQGELGLSIWNGQEPFGGEAQKKVVEFYADHVEFKVPISAPNLPQSGGSVLQSSNGRLVLAAQDDGNFVLYKDGVAIKALFGLPVEQLW